MRSIMVIVLACIISTLAYSQGYETNRFHYINASGRVPASFIADSVALPYWSLLLDANRVAPVTVEIYIDTAATPASAPVYAAFNNDTSAADIITLMPNAETGKPFESGPFVKHNMGWVRLKSTVNYRYRVRLH
jgi:hypothetical protein